MLFPNVKLTCLPITKDILEKIIAQPTKLLEDLNIIIAFKIIYTASEFKKKSIFVETYATRSNSLFVEKD